jgi:hypothetical protein
MKTNYLLTKTNILVAAFLYLLSSVGQAQFTFTTNNAAITITGYTGTNSTVIIPGTTNGYPVGTIGTNAFISHYTVTNLTIPDSVTNIAFQAFAACSGLTTVIMGTNVARIEDRAFDTCTALTNFTLPNSVASIGSYAFHTCGSLPGINISTNLTNISASAFSFCYSLKAITVDALNPIYSSLDGVLFNKHQTILAQCPGGKAGSYAIPEGVTNFYGIPFAGCRHLTSVIIPHSVTNIVIGMFEFCFSLTNVTIPDSVTSIGDFAFNDCTSLPSVTFPPSVKRIGNEVFAECYSLSALYFLGDEPTVGPNTFDDDNVGTVYYLPGTQGWELYYQFLPWLPERWLPQVQVSSMNVGTSSNGFGFSINWVSGQTVVIEACTNLADSFWSPVLTNTITAGSFYFSDPQWTNYPARFYRLRLP